MKGTVSLKPLTVAQDPAGLPSMNLLLQKEYSPPGSRVPGLPLWQDAS